jgi:hypothetical protein
MLGKMKSEQEELQRERKELDYKLGHTKSE